MNIDQLLYVVEVAKTGSITTAAENLHVTPAGVSQSISNLEKRLGITIFARSRKGSSPTLEGKATIKKAYEIISKYQELLEESKFKKILSQKK